MSQKRTVPVKIQGREYRIRADRDEDSVHRAAELLDETMTKVRARSGTADSVDIAVLAALNLASALGGDRTGGASRETIDDRLATLAQLVESTLRGGDAAAS